MNIGTYVYRTNGGLGYQAKSYVKHLNIKKTLCVDLSSLNGIPLNDWFLDSPKTEKGYPNQDEIINFLDGLDVVLLAETPLNYELYTLARQRGIKTITVINPEFYDHIIHRDWPMPDLIILPSVWKEDEIRTHAESRGTKVIQLHHPVDRTDFPFIQRTIGNSIHMAGKPAIHDRNGTFDYLQACPNGTVSTQNSDLAWRIRREYRHSKVHTDIATPQQVYSMGDILVLPRRYGGNCLPLNEALSSGMPVIMPDISPNNYLLPKEWLVPATITDSFEPRTKVDIYSVDIKALTERIEWVKENIRSESQKANEIADTISWTALLPQWQQAIEGLL